MTADQTMAAIQADLDKRFKARMDAIAKNASLATWHHGRALAFAEKTGHLEHELRKALRKIESLENRLDGSAGVGELCADDGEHAFFGKLEDSPCLLDVTEEGRVQTVYIAGGWVDADFFADKAHDSWGRQIAAHVEASREAA
jgi:hypothetical protein